MWQVCFVIFAVRLLISLPVTCNLFYGLLVLIWYDFRSAYTVCSDLRVLGVDNELLYDNIHMQSHSRLLLELSACSKRLSLYQVYFRCGVILIFECFTFSFYFAQLQFHLWNRAPLLRSWNILGWIQFVISLNLRFRADFLAVRPPIHCWL